MFNFNLHLNFRRSEYELPEILKKMWEGGLYELVYIHV
jgi:hypothetical protein